LKRFGEASASYARAISVQPNYAEAHWHEALLRLLNGDLIAAGKIRMEMGNRTAAERQTQFHATAVAEQTGIAGKTIFLHAEQGLGDTLHLCRYVPLAARAAPM
jgi:hypothetical protein